MLIIIEGIDRVGKTTLCNKVAKECCIPIYRHVGVRDFSKIKNSEETDKFKQIVNICTITNANIILDRFHLSDYVYGIIERGYDKKEALHNKQEVESYMHNIKAKVILVLVSPNNLKRSSQEHGKSLVEHNKLFVKAFEESKIIKKINCTYDSLDLAANAIKEELEKENDKNVR